MCDDARKVGANLAIRESHDENVGALEDRIAVVVGRPLFQVMAAIQLHGQSGCRAIEVNNEAGPHVLAPEVIAGNLIPSQMLP
ncbi:MAG TPA: hypothetical protein VGP80_12225 [Gemmatimonadales bacterium]|nr:hypothetical protein [Gemmatimonadales bacterium]